MTRTTRIALGGFGNVGQQLARAILSEPDCGIEIAAISCCGLDAARKRAANIGLNVPAVPAGEMPDHAKVIV